MEYKQYVTFMSINKGEHISQKLKVWLDDLKNEYSADEVELVSIIQEPFHPLDFTLVVNAINK